MRRPRRVPKQDAEEIARNIGRRTAEVRQEHEMTQQELATRLRATVQWISRIENGNENLTLATLVKLANVLEVAVIDLFAAPKSNPRRSRRGRPKKVNAD